MVRNELMQQTEKEIRWKYFVEDETDDYGIILLDRTSAEIKVEQMAAHDHETYYTVEELRNTLDFYNGIREENGEAPYTEEECPIPTEDHHGYRYGDHAISKIEKYYKQGIISEAEKLCGIKEMQKGSKFYESVYSI